MTDEESLIDVIRAEYDDDAPRLVYADWLEENGPHAPSRVHPRGVRIVGDGARRRAKS